jgi:hypothetical protein
VLWQREGREKLKRVPEVAQKEKKQDLKEEGKQDDVAIIKVCSRK